MTSRKHQASQTPRDGQGDREGVTETLLPLPSSLLMAGTQAPRVPSSDMLVDRTPNRQGTLPRLHQELMALPGRDAHPGRVGSRFAFHLKALPRLGL